MVCTGSYMEQKMQEMYDSFEERSKEAAQDLDYYMDALKNNNMERCAEIEKKYGVYGLPHEMVTEEICIILGSKI